MFTRQILIAAAIVGSLALAPVADAGGRNKKFSCPLPNGTTCKSVEEVYEATNFRDNLSTIPTGKAVEVAAPPPAPLPPVPVAGAKVPTPYRCCDPVRTDVTVVGDTLAVASPGPGYTGYQQTAPVVRAAAPTPSTVSVSVPKSDAYRQPAKVMRIYVNPWEDESGDLHMGGYVLTEVEPRRWSVGVQAPTASDTFRLVTQSPVRETAQDASPSADSATSADGRAGNTVASTSNN